MDGAWNLFTFSEKFAVKWSKKVGKWPVESVDSSWKCQKISSPDVYFFVFPCSFGKIQYHFCNINIFFESISLLAADILKMRSAALSLGLTLATFTVIANAIYQKKQFYPSVVYITKSNSSMAVSLARKSASALGNSRDCLSFRLFISSRWYLC